MLHVVLVGAAQPALYSCYPSQPQTPPMAWAGSEGPLLGSHHPEYAEHMELKPGNAEDYSLPPAMSLLGTKASNAGLQPRLCVTSEVIIQNTFLQSPIYLFACKEEHGNLGACPSFCILPIRATTGKTFYITAVISTALCIHLRILGPKSLLNKPTN